MARQRRVVTRKAAETVYKVEGDEVVMNVVPEELLEVDSEEELSDSGKPRIKFKTPQGEAVYEFCGKCVDCGYKRPPVDRDVFTHKAGPRADEQLGIQLAAFRRDGRSGSALCKECYEIWRGQQPRQEARFRVL